MTDIENGTTIAGTTPNQTTTSSILEALVGDDKRFKTLEDLARGKLESDAFIAKLIEENGLLRNILDEEDTAERKTQVKNLIKERVNNMATNPNDSQTATTTSSAQVTQDNNPKYVTPDDVVELLKRARQEEKETSNLEHFATVVTKAFGEKAEETVNARIAELGLDRTAVESIAKQSATAALNLLGLTPKKPSTSSNSVGAGVNTEHVFQPGSSVGQVRNAKYYEALKQQMGIRKFVMDRHTQIQMHKDMVELGDAWDS